MAASLINKVYRGSKRPVKWRFWIDVALTVPRLLPEGAVAVMTITQHKTVLTKRSDEGGLELFVGVEAVGPAYVTWTPTLLESRMFNPGRAYVEIEYWSVADERPLMPTGSLIEFVNGRNTDAD